MIRIAIIVIAIGVLASPVRAQEGQEPMEGEQLFLRECAGCHGPDGDGSSWAPSILQEGAAGAQFMMSTGRMPLREPDDPVRRGEQRLSPDQIEAITSYVAILGGPQVPAVDPDSGDTALGATTYWLNCGSCHGSTGVGAALVNSRNAPPILQATSLEVAEAIRAGPGPMPAFNPGILDEHQLNSVLAYVKTLQTQDVNRGGWTLGRWGPVAEGAAAWLIGVAVVIGAATWIEGTGRQRDRA